MKWCPLTASKFGDINDQPKLRKLIIKSYKLSKLARVWGPELLLFTRLSEQKITWSDIIYYKLNSKLMAVVAAIL